MSDLVPRKTLARQGVNAVGGVAGGVALFVLNAIASPATVIPGLIIGGVLTFAGLGVSRSKENKMAGLVMTGAGALTALASIPLIGGLGGMLLGFGGLGLLGFGIYNAFKFISGMKSRN